MAENKTKLDTGTILPENLIITDEFKGLINKIENSNDNMFITGKAGCGKSTLLEYFRQNTIKKYVILAFTGITAIKARGKTIHSFFKFPPRLIISKDIKTFRDKKLLNELETILIDEASLVRADLLDAIDKSLKKNRKSKDPFGGVQIILIGDLFQLPPIVGGAERAIIEKSYKGPYFFNSKIFKKAEIKAYELTKIFRQSDEKFINLLNKIRISKIEDNDLTLINTRVQDDNFKVPKGVILLSPKNSKVDDVNNKNLELINSPQFEFNAEIKGNFKENEYPVEKNLRLKVGTQIMLVKNDNSTPQRWVNGTIAIISKLEKYKISINIDENIYQVSKEKWDKFEYKVTGKKIIPSVVATYTQYPIKLAWAATIHKCQGQTFKNVCIDMDEGAFTHGQTYVALSRATEINGIFLIKKITYSDLIFDKRVYEFLGNKLETKYSKEVIDYERIIKKRENTAYDKGAWSNDEDLRLLNFYNKGIPIQGIVNIMNREPSDLRRRIKKILKKLS